MSSNGDILRKKMRPRAGAVGPCLAWWQAEADRIWRQTCKQHFEMDVKLSGLTGKQAMAPAALDDMPKIALPFLLGASGRGAALFVLDGTLIDGLIEQQLLGKIMPTQRLSRPVTKIDAGLSEGFVAASIAAITATGQGQLAGLTFGAAEQDRATLRLALGEGRFDILSADIDMGPGVKTGRIELWVPAVAAEAQPKKSGAQNPDMLAMLQDCEVELTARLGGCAPTGQELMALKVGSVLPLPNTALKDVELVDCSGQVFGRGRLGQLDGRRAVRLSALHNAPALPASPKPLAMKTIPMELEVADAASDPAPDSAPPEPNDDEAQPAAQSDTAAS